ncbi:hypothetical protein R3W88_008416 [Solanum pinnatisectum]|uniref:Endonuclease/exonuclease/phosphatase domain-containing protein n=1 Tax=Solanum pinnatisectum TaxID=50273 RepID=A0AAV9M7X8_9SOLN|nr:hypothetical protein R3W88_008416 [Solanum pinnatisectum]
MVPGLLEGTNSIMDTEEKNSGVPFNISKGIDFITCMDDCGMTDAGYIGNIHTWCNGRRGRNRINLRLDRVLQNDDWAILFPNIKVENLDRIGSDHNLMLMCCSKETHNFLKYFRFLNFWTEHKDFLSLVRSIWEPTVQNNHMWSLHQKLKTLSKELSKWSKECINNVFDKVITLEQEVSNLEELYDLDDSDHNRKTLHKTQEEYIKWLNRQDSILRQKARLKWAAEGDKNSKYFHSVIRDRRRRSQIHKIKDRHRTWVEGTTSILEAAIDFFSNMFTQQSSSSNMHTLNHCQHLFSEDDNTMLHSTPTEEEI